MFLLLDSCFSYRHIEIENQHLYKSSPTVGTKTKSCTKNTKNKNFRIHNISANIINKLYDSPDFKNEMISYGMINKHANKNVFIPCDAKNTYIIRTIDWYKIYDNYKQLLTQKQYNYFVSRYGMDENGYNHVLFNKTDGFFAEKNTAMFKKDDRHISISRSLTKGFTVNFFIFSQHIQNIFVTFLMILLKQPFEIFVAGHEEFLALNLIKTYPPNSKLGESDCIINCYHCLRTNESVLKYCKEVDPIGYGKLQSSPTSSKSSKSSKSKNTTGGTDHTGCLADVFDHGGRTKFSYPDKISTLNRRTYDVLHPHIVKGHNYGYKWLFMLSLKYVYL